MSDPKTEFLNKARPLAQTLIAHALSTGQPFGITDVKIGVSAQQEQENILENGSVTKVSSGATCYTRVTLYAGDRVLTFGRNSLDEQALSADITNNLGVIGIAPENPDKRLLESAKVYKGPVIDLDQYDPAPVDQDDLLAYARAAEAAAVAAIAATPGAERVESVSVSRTTGHEYVLATNGLELQDSATMHQAHVSVIAQDSSGMQGGGEFSFARHFSDMADPAELGKKAVQDAVEKLSATLPATGTMPIVLDNGTARGFFGAVLAAIDGGAVFRGLTFLKDKRGQQVLSKGITIVDDPRIPRGASSGCIDSSGVEMRPITFIDDGVLKCFNAGLVESRQLGIDPIGRNDGSTNIRILPGTQTPDELIADIKEGIYVKAFHGGAVKVNDGTYSKQASGFLIRDGKITNIALEGFAVSGNLKDMFMNVSVANDTPALPSNKYSTAAPTTRINGMTIAGR